MAEGAGGAAARRGLEPGTILNNNYRILERIGEGGMGAVWRAANIFMEEDHVAIKVIRAEQAHDDTFRQMFGKEVKAMLRLNNPRLVAYRTFAHDPDLDLSFIVTELIDGPSLKSLIGKRRFSPQELLSLLTELAIGLRAAHKAGIVHRDLAPDNVLLEDGDITRPKIIDFGIVKDTAGDGTTIIGSGFAGKYGFVAPEQLGEPDYDIGPWTDIYSLALVILGLARGKTIDMGNTPGAAIRTRREVPDLSPVAAPLRPLLADMLAHHPEDRIRSAEEVLARAEPIFAELEGWVAPDEEGEVELARTLVMPPLAAPEEEDEVTQVVTETSAVEALATEPDADEDYYGYTEDEQPGGGRNRIAWIILGVIVAIGLAIAGGMVLGEFASPFEQQEPDTAPTPAPAPSMSEPVPTPIETVPPLDIPEILPEVAIATSVPPDAGVRPIDPSSWVVQDDLPRQLYRGENVRGIIAAYLSVAPDGLVTRCTVGSSSEVQPEAMLRPSAVSICRALSSRARFEPFVVPPPRQIAPPRQTETPRRISPPTLQAAPVENAPVDDLAMPEEPEEREVFVRVAFRTAEARPVAPTGN